MAKPSSRPVGESLDARALIESRLVGASWRLALLPDTDALPELRHLAEAAGTDAALVCRRAAEHLRAVADELHDAYGSAQQTMIGRLHQIANEANAKR